MPKHLWNRGLSGWTFQLAIQKAFLKNYGATPLRINLGPLPMPEAKRRARILAGYATAKMGIVGMSRETVKHGLTELASQLADLQKQEARANFDALRASGALHDIEQGFGDFLPEQSIAVHEKAFSVANAEKMLFRSMRERLDVIGREIVRDGEGWETERATYDRVMDRMAQGKPVTKDLPILSVAAAEVIDKKAEALTENSKGYIARLRRAIRAFVSIIGDKRVSDYSPLDVQTYATTLGQLPKNWASDPRLRDLSPLEIIRKAEHFRYTRPLSVTTVAEYLSEFRAVWKIIRATHPHDVLSLAHEDLSITLPRSASRAVQREGLPVDDLNRLLDITARCKRPDDRFLPLLAILTGARLGELTHLQVSDVQPHLDHWIINLRDDLQDEDGNLKNRQLKNDGSSRRIVALPDAIKDTGFIDWVQSLRSGSLWPQLLRTVRPGATASKRQIRLMKAAKVHSHLRQTFHSMRHSYKDHLRTLVIDVRTMDIQVGHALDTVSKSYGSKKLRQDEIVRLATLPLPEGLDLTAYRERAMRERPKPERAVA